MTLDCPHCTPGAPLAGGLPPGPAAAPPVPAEA